MLKKIIIGVVGLLLMAGATYMGASIALDQKTSSKSLGTNLTDLQLTQSTIGGSYTEPGIDTVVSTGQMTDASTTIISVANPYASLVQYNLNAPKNATGTVDLIELVNTGAATTTYTITCGTSTTAYASTGVPAAGIISSGSIATSTNFGTMVNNTNLASTTGGTLSRLQVKPSESVVCVVSSTGGTTFDGAFTAATNAFSGYYKIRWVY